MVATIRSFVTLCSATNGRPLMSVIVRRIPCASGPLGLPLNALIFSIEVLSTTMRLFTLAVRLMINMAVDHLIASIFLGLVALFLPVPALILGVLVIVVQTLVFCLLTSVYIGLATEHEEHH